MSPLVSRSGIRTQSIKPRALGWPVGKYPQRPPVPSEADAARVTEFMQQEPGWRRNELRDFR